MTTLIQEALLVPAKAHCLQGFRRWARSPEFPEEGRIDFLNGDIEVDMSPEDLYTHGTVKAAIVARLQLLVTEQDLGCVFTDRTRVSSPKAGLSAEPDVVVLFWETLDSGRVREVPAASAKPGRYVELEGELDLVVEILSDSSERKDLEQLPALYAAAGVRELWIVDARDTELRFEIRTLRAGVYEQVGAVDGWTRSPVLGWPFRLDRRRVGRHRSSYRLEQRPVLK